MTTEKVIPNIQDPKLVALAKLREPFKATDISKLPKPTAAQTKAVKDDYKQGIRCTVCGGWHHSKVVHLDYVGHAALTSRLLDVDPEWTWEPLARDPITQLPLFDNQGGLWITLTIWGVSRYGYGHATGKSGGDAIKEIIGDALRNAAMRFGAALDLWHKGDLVQIETDEPEVKADVKQEEVKPEEPVNLQPQPERIDAMIGWLNEKAGLAGATVDGLNQLWNRYVEPKIDEFTLEDWKGLMSAKSKIIDLLISKEGEK
jgi:hypothetical protein